MTRIGRIRISVTLGNIAFTLESLWQVSTIGKRMAVRQIVAEIHVFISYGVKTLIIKAERLSISAKFDYLSIDDFPLFWHLR